MSGPYVTVLGIAQDGGHPQAGCLAPCCRDAWGDPGRRHRVSCLGIVIPGAGAYLIDATPDLGHQIHDLGVQTSGAGTFAPAGIFLTHAHMGHVLGLLHLGREAMGAKAVPVFAMPRLLDFLSRNAPWSLLASWGHAAWRPLAAGRPVPLTGGVGVTPVAVPHRGELSETVGYVISGARGRILYVPDIDSWDLWDVPLEEAVARVDHAYLDGTFFDEGELPGRFAAVAHPSVRATVERIQRRAPELSGRVRFLHLNHTNPLLQGGGEARDLLDAAGCHVAREGERRPI
jgi:pyrroloquinoline quinone biosynthesis protein B